MPDIPDNEKPPVIVLWVLWFAFVCAIVIYQFTLGHGIPQGPNAPSAGLNPLIFMAVGEIVVAAFIRWFLIPRVGTRQKMLVLMVIGIALSESAEFFGIFLVSADMPQTKLALFVASLLSALQFAPLFASPKPVSLFHESS